MSGFRAVYSVGVLGLGIGLLVASAPARADMSSDMMAGAARASQMQNTMGMPQQQNTVPSAPVMQFNQGGQYSESTYFLQFLNMFSIGGSSSTSSSSSSSSSSSGGGSGGAPSPEVNVALGLAMAAGTVAFLRRRKAGAAASAA